jgi:hypothetical protein
MSEYDYYHLDGYDLFYLPGPGGYSGYNPKRRRTEVETLSAKIALHWGIFEEDQVITITAPYASREEFLSLRDRYLALDSQGNPRRYYFEDQDYTYEVEILEVEGEPYRGLYDGVQVDLKVLSVHQKEQIERFYLHSETASFAGEPTDTEATGETDMGLAGPDRLICLQMLPGLPEGSAVTREWALQLSAQHKNLVGIWASAPLCRRRLPMGTYCRITSAIFEEGEETGWTLSDYIVLSDGGGGGGGGGDNGGC